MRVQKKSIVSVMLVVVAVVIIATSAVLGTIAYLKTTAPAVTNTFSAVGLLKATPANYTIADNGFFLYEHKMGNNGALLTSDVIGETGLVKQQTLVVTPGTNLPKDPFVRVNGLLQNAYLFVEVKETALGEKLSYELSADWTMLTDFKGAQGGVVYAYKNVITKNDGTALANTYILKDNQMVVAADEGDVNDTLYGGTLAFYGYLTQSQGFADATAAYKGCFAFTLNNPK